jgi:predicted secreted Zn-dependent protease
MLQWGGQPHNNYMDENEQSLKQKKILLATSEHAPIIIELMKDCMPQVPIIAKTEWETIVNAVTLEVHGTMLRTMVDYLEEIRKGSLHNPQ